MKMDQKPKNDDNSTPCMDNLAALNIVPFLGLMNLVEVKYFDMPEVYRTMLAILCDYDPLLQDNIIKTRRYLSELLAREPELAQCLLNFIDSPVQPPATSVAMDGSATDTNKNHSCQQCPPDQLSAMLIDEKPENCMEKEAIPVPKQFCFELGTAFQSSQKTGVPKLDYHNRCFISTSTSAAVHGQTDIQPSLMVTEAPIQAMSLQPSATHPQTTYSDQMSKSVPFLNIYHKDLFAPDKSVADQLQATSFFLPGFSTSHLNSIKLPGLDRTTKPVTANDLRDHMIFTPSLTQSSNQVQVEVESAAPVTQTSNSNVKTSRHCSIAETQTLFTGAEKRTSPCDSASPAETDIPVKVSRVPPASSSLETLISMAATAGQSHTDCPNICLSKLLGQPSVAYLPAGHFIDSHNSLLDPAVNQPIEVEKLPFSSSILSGKTNSAAAKLHLLSTQAGSDKSALLQTGCMKASVTGSLSSSVPSVHRDSTVKTTVKVTSKPGCKKTITFSKIVPVLKLDSLTGQENKANIISYDKQIQVGERRLYSKKSKMTAKNEGACQMHSDTRPFANDPNSQENMPERQPLADCQEVILDWERQQKESHPMSVNQQKCSIAGKLQVIKQRSQSSTTCREETGKPPANEPMQISEKIVDHHELPVLEPPGDQKPSYGQDEGWMPKGQAVLFDKLRPRGEKGTSSRQAETCTQPKVQVVAVSMGSSHSLSAFPYIQQMILPDGQVSTIAHNSHTTPPLHQFIGKQQSDAATSVYVASKPPSTAETAQEGKDMPSNAAAQIVLPRSQLKLSVSIQTPSVNCSHKKHKNITAHLTDLPKLKEQPLTTETAQTYSEVTKMKGQGKSHKTYVDKTTLSDATNLLTDPCPTGNCQARRKRSSSCRRNVAAKNVKLHL